MEGKKNIKKDYHKNKNITIRLSNEERICFEEIKKGFSGLSDAKIIKKIIKEYDFLQTMYQANKVEIAHLKEDEKRIMDLSMEMSEKIVNQRNENNTLKELLKRKSRG